jgi:hypothetical protein
MTTLDFVVHTLLMPKWGETQADCEDALAIACDRSDGGLRAAVADGASSSSFSGLWARMLTQSFVDKPFRTDAQLRTRLPKLMVRWCEHVFGRDLPWHALERAKRGAFAALAGVEIASGRPAAWRGFALGDSCILQVRGGKVIFAAPISESRGFTNDPVLISTEAERNAGVGTNRRPIGGVLLPGDTLLLATDALAQFVLAAAERGTARLDVLLDALERGGAHIHAGRAAGSLRNDDVAAVLIRVS